MKKILVKGPALSASGYGEQARYALRALRANNDKFEIFLDNINWGKTGWTPESSEERDWFDHLIGKTVAFKQQGGTFDISLQVTIPNEWEPLAPVNVGYTAGIETTRIAPEWIEKSNMMDKIIVVSNHAKYGFDNTSYQAQHQQTKQVVELKVNTDVEVVNYSKRDIEEEKVELDLTTDFNFLSVCQWGPRKNLETTLACFLEEFKEDNVGLVLKTSTMRNSLVDRRLCEKRLKEVLKNYPDRKCKVYLLHGNMTAGEMKYLYKHPKIHAMVSTTHGEGFGLPLFEATLEGLPITVPAWSGHVDFLYAPQFDKKKRKKKMKPQFLKIDYDLKPVQPQAVWPGVIQADSMWAFARKNSTKDALREMYKNHNQYVAKAKKLQEHNLEKFTQERFNQEFVDAMGLDFSAEEAQQEWLAKVGAINEI